MYTAFLVDPATNRVLLTSGDIGCVNLLHGAPEETCLLSYHDFFPVLGTNMNVSQLRRDIPRAEWLHYRFDFKENRIGLAHASASEIEKLRPLSDLLCAKLDALVDVVAALNRSRCALATPDSFGETVRFIKKDQAEKFKESGYDNARMREFLFVWQYAQVHGVSPTDAAERIII